MAETFDDSGLPAPPKGVAYAPHLVVLLECDRPTAGGARFSLEGVDRVTIGRGDARTAARYDEAGVRTLDVRVPGRSMSSSHARLVRVGEGWAIEDQGSRNGTWVDGDRVTRAVLAVDEMFELGHTLFRVRDALAMPPGSPPDLDIASPEPRAHATLDPSFAAGIASLTRVAPTEVPILLLGESGAGKEVLARWVHAHTGRAGPFVAVNCGAIPESLVESQLFGHVKGAFSGAVRDEAGFVRSAEGGTLLLDEIADLPKPSQAALLRMLQEREVVPVGAARPIKVDVRVVAATHQALEAMVARGDFRRDLFARVAGFTVTLPALRDRRDDLGILVAALLPKVARARASEVTLSPDVGRALLRYEWPLNVRELEQCLAASVALAPDGVIRVAHLPPSVARVLDAPLVVEEGRTRVALSERDARLRLELLEQLARHDGNLADVAREMGKARMQIHRWCHRFGIDPNVYRR
jgi:transcriptional regulator of acetoin/glycerol metabolism